MWYAAFVAQHGKGLGMRDASEATVYCEEGVLRCGAPGRKRARCGRALLKGGMLKCADGHEVSLDEVLEKGFLYPELVPIVRWVLNMARVSYPGSKELALEAVREVLSPPYTTAPKGSEFHYAWFKRFQERFQILLMFADGYDHSSAEALRRMWVERNDFLDPAVPRALELLARHDDVVSRMQRDHLIDCGLRTTCLTTEGILKEYYLAHEARKILGETEQMYLFEDAMCALNRGVSDIMQTEAIIVPSIVKHDDFLFEMVMYVIHGGKIQSSWNMSVRTDGSIEGPVSHFTVTSAVLPNEADVAFAVEERVRERSHGLILSEKGELRISDVAIFSKERWRLDVLQDLRSWLCYLHIEKRSAHKVAGKSRERGHHQRKGSRHAVSLELHIAD